MKPLPPLQTIKTESTVCYTAASTITVDFLIVIAVPSIARHVPQQ